MNLSQKCQYALRAVFELAKRGDHIPVSGQEIAEAQAIPPRFLLLILGQLRQGGFVASRRGVRGGYMLAAAPDELSVGDIIRFMEGPLEPVKCIGGRGAACPLRGGCAFLGLWQRAKEAVRQVYDSTTFADLLREERIYTAGRGVDYCI